MKTHMGRGVLWKTSQDWSEFLSCGLSTLFQSPLSALWFKIALGDAFVLGLSLIRKIAVGIVGFTVLLIGIALVVLPGPAFIVIPLGLAILATEFVWARSLLNKARAKLPGQKSKPAKAKQPVGPY
jgi:hypothetical protein